MTSSMKSLAGKSGIDIEEALARLGGDEELLVELTGIFVEDSQEMLRAMRSALDSGEAVALQNAAHKARGAIAIFGDGSALRLASDIESFGCSGEIGAARQAFPTFESELNLMTATLSRIAAAA